MACNITSASRFNEINGELDSRINLAKTAIALDLVELARQQIDEAQKIISAHGLSDKTVYLDIMSSSIAIQQLDLQQAAELLEKYPGHGEMQDDVAMALLINKIRLALLKGNDASALLEEFNSAAQSQAKYLPRALRFQAQQAHLQQRYADSDELYAQALSHYRERADSTGVVAGLKEWGANLLQRNEWKQAALRYQDLYKIAVSLKQQAATVAALDGLIQVYEQQGNQRQLQWARQQMGKLTVTP